MNGSCTNTDTRMLPLIEDRHQTDRVTINAADCSTLLTLTRTLTLTYDLDFQSTASYGHDLYAWKNGGGG